MKKSMQALVLAAFAFATVGSPFVAAADTAPAAPTLLPDGRNPVMAAGYYLSAPVVATTTWQKGYDQTVKVEPSSNLQALISQAVRDASSQALRLIRQNQSDLSIAIYLVPTDASSIPTSTATMYRAGAVSYKGATYRIPSLPSFNPYDGSGSTLGISLDPIFNPSAALYVPAPAKMGYFVGYIHDYASSTHGANADRWTLIDPKRSTTDLASIDFAWLPVGSYQVYAAVGVAKIEAMAATSSSPGSGSTAFRFDPNQAKFSAPFSAFPILLPEVAASRIAGAAAQSGSVRTPVPAQKDQPAYSATLAPLPQSVSRGVSFLRSAGRYSVTISAVEYDTVVSSVAPATISLAPSRDPIIAITSPVSGDQWQRGSRHDVTWLTNFKRSNDNNTGIKAYNGVAIVQPYGFNVQNLRSTTVDQYSLADQIGVAAATDVAALVGLQVVPVIGQVVGVILVVLDLFGVFDDNQQPFAVPVSVKAVPTAATLAACASGKSIICQPSYKVGDGYLENAKVTVGPGALEKLPSGTYQVVVSAKWSSAPAIVATSTIFSILPKAPSISSVSIASTTAGMKVSIVGQDFSTSTNYVSFAAGRPAVGYATGSGRQRPAAPIVFSAPSATGTSITAVVPGLNPTYLYQVSVADSYGTSSAFSYIPSFSSPIFKGQRLSAAVISSSPFADPSSSAPFAADLSCAVSPNLSGFLKETDLAITGVILGGERPYSLSYSYNGFFPRSLGTMRGPIALPATSTGAISSNIPLFDLSGAAASPTEASVTVASADGESITIACKTPLAANSLDARSAEGFFGWLERLFK